MTFRTKVPLLLALLKHQLMLHTQTG